MLLNPLKRHIKLSKMELQLAFDFTGPTSYVSTCCYKYIVSPIQSSIIWVSRIHCTSDQYLLLKDYMSWYSNHTLGILVSQSIFTAVMYTISLVQGQNIVWGEGWFIHNMLLQIKDQGGWSDGWFSAPSESRLITNKCKLEDYWLSQTLDMGMGTGLFVNKG